MSIAGVRAVILLVTNLEMMTMLNLIAFPFVLVGSFVALGYGVHLALRVARGPYCEECGVPVEADAVYGVCTDCLYEGSVELKCTCHTEAVNLDYADCEYCEAIIRAMDEMAECEGCGQYVDSCICGTDDEWTQCGGCARWHHINDTCGCGWDEPLPWTDDIVRERNAIVGESYSAPVEDRCDNCGGAVGANAAQCDVCAEHSYGGLLSMRQLQNNAVLPCERAKTKC